MEIIPCPKNIFLSMKEGIEIYFFFYHTWDCATVGVPRPDRDKSWTVETQSHFCPHYVALEDLFSIVSFHFHIRKVEIIMFALCIVVKTWNSEHKAQGECLNIVLDA